MGVYVVRYQRGTHINWGVLQGEEILPLGTHYEHLADLLAGGMDEVRSVKDRGAESIKLQDVQLLSPVTAPARIICQGVNYASHREESGMAAQRPPFNLIFSKADSSLTGPYSDVICPSHVKLLDYEIELGLVIGKEISGKIEVNDENLSEYVAGLVIANDISARDVQLPQGQWLKGKSYRTFCPTGPYLYLWDPEEAPKIHQLDLKLWVNDELRQSANTSQLLYKPAETLTELSGVMDLSPGDLLLTGTPGGVAQKLTPEVSEQMMNPFLDGKKKMEVFIESQLGNDRFLKHHDRVRCEIKSADGAIDLGVQINKIVFESAHS